MANEMLDEEAPVHLTKDQIHFCLGLIATNKDLAIAFIHFAQYRQDPLRPLLTTNDIAAFQAEMFAVDTRDLKEERNGRWEASGQILIAVMRHLQIEILSPRISVYENQKKF